MKAIILILGLCGIGMGNLSAVKNKFLAESIKHQDLAGKHRPRGLDDQRFAVVTSVLYDAIAKPEEIEQIVAGREQTTLEHIRALSLNIQTDLAARSGAEPVSGLSKLADACDILINQSEINKFMQLVERGVFDRETSQYFSLKQKNELLKRIACGIQSDHSLALEVARIERSLCEFCLVKLLIDSIAPDWFVELKSKNLLDGWKKRFDDECVCYSGFEDYENCKLASQIIAPILANGSLTVQQRTFIEILAVNTLEDHNMVCDTHHEESEQKAIFGEVQKEMDIVLGRLREPHHFWKVLYECAEALNKDLPIPEWQWIQQICRKKKQEARTINGV